MKHRATIAFMGNPNSGKTTLFNRMTGLSLAVANFPGVTVQMHKGTITLSDLGEVDAIDFPGCYSLYPNTIDERVVVNALLDEEQYQKIDLIVVVADASNLEKHLLLVSQLKDIDKPIILVLNMSDLALSKGIEIDHEQLASGIHAPVISLSARTGSGIEALKTQISSTLQNGTNSTVSSPVITQNTVDLANKLGVVEPTYRQILRWHHHDWLPPTQQEDRKLLIAAIDHSGWIPLHEQISETLLRFDRITPLVKKIIKGDQQIDNRTHKIDRILAHSIWGPLIFLLLMVFVFQAIYTWSSYPMDWVESGFTALGELARTVFPDHWLTDLLVDGILAGLSGIMVFAPQIAIFFFLMALLEESGYMARVVYLFDGLMRKFGLNGRSLISLISSGACAIPAIMSARTIPNQKERIATILVSPLISCSARIPVYIVLVGFAVAPGSFWGFEKQGLAFMGLYLIGILSALLISMVLHLFLPNNEPSFLMLELPTYKLPVWRNVLFSVWTKVKAFVTEAGKVILVCSMILWFLASYGPSQKRETARNQVYSEAIQQDLPTEEIEARLASVDLENSYAGMLGKFMEPAIAPLGYDWKIGIALLASFAAREVFVGTLATIYSVGDPEDTNTLRQRMSAERLPDKITARYSIATSVSLLLFFVFAMQCMSTLAITRKETGTWKWPIIQLVYMTMLAYITAFGAYQLLS